ncbi:hypothetical protein [Arthrobacter sp. 260]|uniref:hypothetical protein n=1 Tax=Arthrobacter sp. 260 TaxID=2735314 RepID=UPI0014913E24|nr:hypothetical protein [Arthrobacter sp. 260]NOJ60335.1 hypothetical protein [Arthrobacter sp. 260]
MSGAQFVHGERRRRIHGEPFGVVYSIGDRNGFGNFRSVRHPDAVGQPYNYPVTLGQPDSRPCGVA